MDNYIVVRFSYKMYYGFRLLDPEQFKVFTVALAYVYLLYKETGQKFYINDASTNETFEILPDDFQACFSFSYISKKDIKSISKSFNIDEENSWGIFPNIKDIIEIYQENN